MSEPTATAGGTGGQLLVPNSFQMPNVYVDEVLEHLTGAETKILLFIARMTFGWNKRRERIASREIIEGSGVGRSQTFEALAHLDAMQVITRFPEPGRSSSYSLQVDPAQFRLPQASEPALDSPEISPRVLKIGPTPSTDPSGIPDGGSPLSRTGTRPEFRTGPPYHVNPTLNPLSQTQPRTRARAHEGAVADTTPLRPRTPVPKPRELRAASGLRLALIAGLGVEPATPSEEAAWAKAEAELERIHAPPEEVEARARRYLQVFPTVARTPQGLLRQWSQVDPRRPLPRRQERTDDRPSQLAGESGIPKRKSLKFE